MRDACLHCVTVAREAKFFLALQRIMEDFDVSTHAQDVNQKQLCCVVLHGVCRKILGTNPCFNDKLLASYNQE